MKPTAANIAVAVAIRTGTQHFMVQEDPSMMIIPQDSAVKDAFSSSSSFFSSPSSGWKTDGKAKKHSLLITRRHRSFFLTGEV